jgi:AI-2 transport protein TqsA
MNSSIPFSPLLRFLMGAACLVVIIAGLKAAASLLNLIFLALLLAQSMSPLLNWLMNRRLSPALAVLVTLGIVILGGVGVVTLLASSITQLFQKIPVYQSKLLHLQEIASSLLASWGIDLSEFLSLEALNPSRVASLAGSFIGGLAQILGDAVLIIFIVAIVLFEMAYFHHRLSTGVDENSMVGRFHQLSADTRKYLAIMGWTGLLQALVNVGILLLLRIDYAVTWGVLFFLLNFIPSIGFFFALLPPALVALLDHGWQRALAVVVAYWAVNFVNDNIVKPRYMKKGLDISILWIILSLIFWSWVLGAIGAVLAVPLTLTIKRFLEPYLNEKSFAGAAGVDGQVQRPESKGGGYERRGEGT